MQISIELSLSPLQDDYDAPIKDFIKTLRTSGFRVIESPLSTQVFGDYDRLMEFLTEEIKETFQSADNILLNMRLIKGNYSTYAADF